MTVSDLDHMVVATLRDSFARADTLLPWHQLQSTPPTEPSWLPWSDLAGDGTGELDPWLPAVQRAFSAPVETAASYVLGWCATALAAPLATLLVAERRVPALDPDRLWLRRTAGQWVDATAVDAGSSSVTVLPDDRLAGCAGVRVVATVDRLRRVAVEEFAGRLAPVVDAVRRRSRLGRRTAWALAADSLAHLVAEAGNGLGRPLLGRDEADALFATAAGLLEPRRGWVNVRHGGRDHVFARRTACCLAYKTPVGEYCVTCPGTSDADCAPRLLAYLDRLS